MKNPVVGGWMLIAGGLAGVMVMLHHPTAQGLIGSGGSAHAMRMNVHLHGFAIAFVPVTFVGLLAVARRLEWPDLSIAALAAFATGAIAVIGAAVASGFVSTGIIQHSLASGGTGYDPLLADTGLWNQGYASVHVVADSIGIVLLSLAILRSRRIARVSGLLGLLVGAAILIAFFFFALKLDVHGFGLVTLARGVWLIALGVALGRSAGRV